MRPVLEVRTVTASDIPACARIEAACFPPEEAASPEKLAKRAALYPDGFVVGVLDGEVVGFANGAATHQPDLADEAFKDLVGHDPTGTALVIFSLTVRPDLQGRGLSRPLLEGFLSRAKALRKERVLLLCKAHLVPYYARFGFVDLGRSASTHGGAVWHEMRLDL